MRPEPAPPPVWGSTAMAVLTAVWLIGGPWLAIGSVMDLWTFFGEQPTAADHATAQRHAVLATALATCCPAGAWYLAVRWHRSVAATVFGVGAALGLAGGLLLVGLVSPSDRSVPVPEDGPRVCQEHSGGDSTCPGG
jgi:hypothetical protein